MEEKYVFLLKKSGQEDLKRGEIVERIDLAAEKTKFSDPFLANLKNQSDRREKTWAGKIHAKKTTRDGLIAMLNKTHHIRLKIKIHPNNPNKRSTGKPTFASLDETWPWSSGSSRASSPADLSKPGGDVPA